MRTCAQRRWAQRFFFVLDLPLALRQDARIPPRKTRDALLKVICQPHSACDSNVPGRWISRRRRRDKPKMKSAKNLHIALLAIALLVASSVVTHPQTAPPTNDQTKTGPSGTKQKGKKGADSAATPNKNTPKKSIASTAAPTPAAPAATPSSTPASSAPAPKTTTAHQAHPATSADIFYLTTHSHTSH